MGLPAFLTSNRLFGKTVVSWTPGVFVPETGSLLSDKRIGRTIRVTLAPATPASFVVDLTSASYDTLALLNCTADANVSIKAYADNSNPPTTLVATFVHREFDRYAKVAVVSQRYLKIEFQSTPGSAFDLGQAVADTRVAFSRGWSRREGREPIRYEDTDNISELGARRNKTLYAVRTRTFPFIGLTAADLAILEALYASQSGREIPLVWIPDLDQPEVYYGTLDERELDSQFLTPNRRSATVSIREEPRGTRIFP